MVELLGMVAVLLMSVPSNECQAAGMLSLLKRHEIQVLVSAGFAASDIAARVGVSTDTVVRVASEPPVEHVDDRAEHRRRGIGRPSKSSAFADRVKSWVDEEPDLPTQELLRRAQSAGYRGHKSAFYALVAAIRPSRAAPIVRFEGLPGEFSQHDFGQIDVVFDGGRKKRIHFFASRLKYSRFVAVSIVENEQTETLIRSLIRHFVAFGGVPLMAVFDRPRTIVTKGGRGREVEAFNTTFAQAVVEIGVGVEMCAPRSGNQKGSVESLVKWVKNSFFKWQKFVDEQDLEAKLAAWVREVNFETPSRATKVIPETRRREEAPRLRAVRVLPETFALRVPVFVGPTAEVVFDGVAYTMPPELMNVPATAFVYERTILFVTDRQEVEHTRRRRGEARASLPEHRAQKLAAVHGERARKYEMREQLLALGPDALVLLTELVHGSPRTAHESVERLHAMLDEYGEQAMRAAFARVVRDRTLNVQAVRQILASAHGPASNDVDTLPLWSRLASQGGAR